MKKLLIILSILLSSQAFAQLVDVKDTVLAGILCDRYPEAMVNNCTQLDLSKEAFISDSLDISDTTITDITPLLELTETVYLRLVNNNFDTIAGDFSKLTKLEELDLSSNDGFSSFPDFSSITSPYLHSLSMAKTTIIDSLKIDNLKNSLKHLNFRNNILTEVPDLTTFPNLEVANLLGNRLTFLDMEPFINDTNTEYYFFRQRTFGLLPRRLLEQYETDTLELKFEVEDLHPNNVYYWYKDNELIDTTSGASLNFYNLTLADSGQYHLVIRNPAFPNLSDTLHTRPIALSVLERPEECVTLETSPINVKTTCETHLLAYTDVDVDSITFELRGQTDTLSFQENNNVLVDLTDGLYELLVSTPTCAIIYPESIYLQSETDCDKVLSPNGDGIGDRFYVEHEEPFKVIDKSGRVLNELVGPIFWDGTNSSGTIINAGYYILLFESGKTIPITIER